MKLLIGSDHAGFRLKEMLKPFLEEHGFKYEDVGAYKYNENDDYTDFVVAMSQVISDDPGGNKGIFLAGSGQGEAMLANRFSGVRAAVYYGGSEEIIRLSREHNNANLLSIGARFVTEEEAMVAIKLWLNTDFPAEERHARRIKKIEDLSKS